MAHARYALRPEASQTDVILGNLWWGQRSIQGFLVASPRGGDLPNCSIVRDDRPARRRMTSAALDRPSPPAPARSYAGRLLAAMMAAAVPAVAAWAQPAPAAGVVAAAVQGAPIELLGVTLYDAAALLTYAQAVAGQGGTVDLAGVARVVEQLYHEDGWFLAEARAFRDPASGRQSITVDEGRVRAVEVAGVAAPTGRRIAGYLTPVLDGSPLRLDAFERALMLAGDLSGISLRTEFAPDPAAGGYRAVVHAQQRRSTFAALLDNVPRSSTVGTYVSGETYSLLAPGDLARLVVGGNLRTNGREGGLTGGVFYRLPIGNDGLYTEVYASQLGQAREFAGPTIDQRMQRGQLLGAVVGYPVLRSLDGALYAILAAERRAVDAEGPTSVADRSTALRVSGYYTSHNAEASALRTGLTLSVGNAYSAQNPGVDRQFWHLRAVAGTVLRHGEAEAGYALRLEGYAKYASQTLPEVERLALGDRDRMRGYMFGAATGDTGAVGTIELSRHIPLEAGVLRAVTPSVFLDAGVARKNGLFPAGAVGGVLPGTLRERTVSLASVGFAARLDLAEGFGVSGWVGLPLIDGGTGVQYKPAAYVRLTKAW